MNLWQGRQYEQVRFLLERAARVRGHEARALIALAEIEVEQDHYEEAARRLETALEIRPSSQLRRYLKDVRRVAQESKREE